jgi:hypothetical protein
MQMQLEHGDCLERMRLLQAESVDVVVTSPPYNLGIGYGTYRDTVPRDAYLKWTVDWCREAKRLLKPDGSFFLNLGAAPSNPMLPHEVLLALRDATLFCKTLSTGSNGLPSRHAPERRSQAAISNRSTRDGSILTLTAIPSPCAMKAKTQRAQSRRSWNC